MTIDQLRRTEHEARRLIFAIDAAVARIKSDTFGLKHGYVVGGSPETAAVRRASMDLTRALAELRRTK